MRGTGTAPGRHGLCGEAGQAGQHHARGEGNRVSQTPVAS